MSARTAISWTERTWNPVTGCDRVSPGCDRCYALTMARRLKAMGQPRYQRDGDPRTSGPGFGVTVHPEAMHEPLRWRQPARVFVNSMSDLLHPRVPDDAVAEVFAVMALAQRHTFQLLTKRHARLRALLADNHFVEQVAAAARRRDRCDPALYDAGWPLPNVWVGVSVEDQQRAEARVPALLATPAAVRWVSCEPLLGPVDLGRAACPGTRAGSGAVPHLGGCCALAVCQLDWVVLGGESGPGARPMDLAWARSLRDQCAAGGVPVHVKQLGSATARQLGARGAGHRVEDLPADLRLRDQPCTARSCPAPGSAECCR